MASTLERIVASPFSRLHVFNHPSGNHAIHPQQYDGERKGA